MGQMLKHTVQLFSYINVFMNVANEAHSHILDDDTKYGFQPGNFMTYHDISYVLSAFNVNSNPGLSSIFTESHCLRAFKPCMSETNPSFM